jgi:hypothetical protein
MIMSLANDKRFFETTDHTFRGLERGEYDHFRKSLSRWVVTSEQDRQRKAGISDPHKISSVYRSFCSHSAQRANLRGVQDALVAGDDFVVPNDNESPLVFHYEPQMLALTHSRTKSMNPSMISCLSNIESSRRPPYAPRSSTHVSPNVRVEEASTSTKILTNPSQTGSPGSPINTKLKSSQRSFARMDVAILPYQRSKSKSLRSLSRKASPMKLIESLSP